MELDIKNISVVAQNNLCTGCGICVPVCPEDCIVMEMDEKKGVFQSKVDLDKCTNCTACLKSCPPITWSNKPKTSKADIRLGDYLEFKAVFSNNNIIRKEAASGGFITSFLLFLLKKKLIDGAITTKRDPFNPLIGIPFIATTEEEIISSSTSIYGPVKFDNIISELIEQNNSTKRYVIVGLPCHIEGISRAQETHKILKRNIILKIGIVCGQSPSLYAYDYSFKRLNINKDNLLSFKNRGAGWPGFMQIREKHKSLDYPYPGKYSMGMVLSSPVFTPTACQKCVDSVGYNSDITASDAWLPKFKGDTIGRSLIMIKTPFGQELINSAISENVFTTEEIEKSEFIKANIGVINKAYKGHINAKFLGTEKYKLRYHKEMIFPENPGWKRIILLYFYVLNIIPIHLIGAKKISVWANDYVLLYYKFINYLKKKFVYFDVDNKNFQQILDTDVVEVKSIANYSVKIVFNLPNLEYLCGQYISVVKIINNRKIIRAYSLASTYGIDKLPYIIVKEIEHGKMSKYLVNELKAGEKIEIIIPQGNFYNKQSSKTDLFLIGAGSGITPLFSILKFQLSSTNRNVILLYQNRNSDSVILSQELNELQSLNPKRFKIINVLSREKWDKAYYGHINEEIFTKISQSHGGFRKSHFYICGPPKLTESVEEILKKSNITPNQIFKEAFYQSEDLKEVKDFVEKYNIKTSKLKIIDFDIEFDSIECKPGQSILTASKINDIDIPHSCLTGECKLCKCRLIEGEIIDKNKNIIASGNEILTCMSYPLVENIKIEL